MVMGMQNQLNGKDKTFSYFTHHMILWMKERLGSSKFLIGSRCLERIERVNLFLSGS